MPSKNTKSGEIRGGNFILWSGFSFLAKIFEYPDYYLLTYLIILVNVGRILTIWRKCSITQTRIREFGYKIILVKNVKFGQNLPTEEIQENSVFWGEKFVYTQTLRIDDLGGVGWTVEVGVVGWTVEVGVGVRDKVVIRG